MNTSNWGDNLKPCLPMIKTGLKETKASFKKENFTKKGYIYRIPSLLILQVLIQ